jgi:hypothetical protein
MLGSMQSFQQDRFSRIVMSIALKLLPKKLLLMPPQLLQWIQMYQMCYRR